MNKNNTSPLFETQILKGKAGWVVGIANEESIAYGCGRHFRGQGAKLAVTYLNEKAISHVTPLAEELEAEIFMPTNIQKPEEVTAFFAVVTKRWGCLDSLSRSIAFMPRDDLPGRITDCSPENFLKAVDISCHSFLRLAKLAEPLMSNVRSRCDDLFHHGGFKEETITFTRM